MKILYWVFLAIILIVGLFIGTDNIQQEQNCIELTEILDVVLDKQGLIHKCYIIEEGEEYTIKQYRNKLKNEILNIRS